MTHASVRAGALVLLTFIAVACGSGAHAIALGAAGNLQRLRRCHLRRIHVADRAYGNPDTNAPSALRTTLEDAVAAGDAAGAERASTAMLNELEAGRRFAATAARWQPGATTAASLDRLLLAFEAWTSAKLALMANPSAIDPQTAFEQAGGVEAWTGALQGIQETPIPPDASPTPCRAFSGEI